MKESVVSQLFLRFGEDKACELVAGLHYRIDVEGLELRQDLGLDSVELLKEFGRHADSHGMRLKWTRLANAQAGQRRTCHQPVERTSQAVSSSLGFSLEWESSDLTTGEPRPCLSSSVRHF